MNCCFARHILQIYQIRQSRVHCNRPLTLIFCYKQKYRRYLCLKLLIKLPRELYFCIAELHVWVIEIYIHVLVYSFRQIRTCTYSGSTLWLKHDDRLVYKFKYNCRTHFSKNTILQSKFKLIIKIKRVAT